MGLLSNSKIKNLLDCQPAITHEIIQYKENTANDRIVSKRLPRMRGDRPDTTYQKHS